MNWQLRQDVFAEALRHFQAGRRKEAERFCRQVLNVDARHVDALHLLGVLAHQSGRHDIAVELITKALTYKPDHAVAHYNLGFVFQVQGKLDEAVASYGHAITHKPDHAKAHGNLGIALQAQGKLDAAVASYGRALAYRPDDAEMHYNLANALVRQGKLDEAVASYGRALTHRPDYAEAHLNLGNTFKEQGKLEAAAAAYGRALAYRPDDAEAHYGLGNTLKEQGDDRGAAAAYGQALSHKPDYAEAHYNLGKTLKGTGKREEEVASYGRALAHKPDMAEAHYSLGLLLLQTGRYAEGWPEFEWRWRLKSVMKHGRDFGVPRWEGEDLTGKTILLYAEQGMGDTIQFCRYVPMIAAQGARVVLEVRRPLVRLVNDLPGVAQIIARDDPLPPFDLHCPLMSLPRIFGTRLETIPAPIPYLTAMPERVAEWRDRLPQQGRRIGIVWQGSPTYKDDHNRSVPLACFAPLARIPGVRLISLQKVHGLDQLAHLPDGMAVETLGADFDEGANAFLDSAAVMTNLDLIVTVDTAIGHLAGALGLPVWLPLATNPHWVWMLERDDTPWYPRTRLFRQSSPGDWDGVMTDMARALRANEGAIKP